MPINPTAGQPLLEPLRDSLRALLGVPCFIRRSRAQDALLVTDAPRRAPIEQLTARLSQSGDWIARPETGLLHLDPSPALWRRLMADAPICPERWPEAYSAYPFLASCALRLTLEPVLPELQPIGPLRLTLKALEAGDFDTLQNELPQILAALLRRHDPLPEAAGRYVLAELQKACER